MNSTASMTSDRGKKSRGLFTIRKDKKRTSNVSIRDALVQPTVELSLEIIQSHNGFKTTYLRVYCQHIRTGDHFKTVKVLDDDTVERCIERVIESYYASVGSPHQFELLEIIGKIATIPQNKDNIEPLITFTETRARVLPLTETVYSIFNNTTPGPGLSRRLELRWITKSYEPTATKSDSTLKRTESSPTRFFRVGQLNGSKHITFRDSRNYRSRTGLQPPKGPHLLLLRGSSSANDTLMLDLTRIIDNQRTTDSVLIGSTANCSLVIHPPYSGEQTIFAKLVGYDQPLPTENDTILKGAVYLESVADSDNQNEQSVLPIIVNDVHLAKPNKPFFTPRLLKPGDFIFFGAQKSGYVFLFKDPRWIPDNQLDLQFTSTLSRSHVSLINNERPSYISSNQSDTDSSIADSHTTDSNIYVVDQLPRLSWLSKIVSNLFLSPLSYTDSPNQATVDVFDSSCRWSIDPWRSATLLAHLVRSIAGFLVDPNPPIPNGDVKRNNPHAIHEYVMNQLVDIRELFENECRDIIFLEHKSIYPRLWLSLFCHDLCIHLSPGWLKSIDGLSMNTSHNRILELNRSSSHRRSSTDENESSPTSHHSSGSHRRVVEKLHPIVILRESAVRMVQHCINIVVETSNEVLSDYMYLFYDPTVSIPGTNFGRRDSSPLSSLSSIGYEFDDLATRLQSLADCIVDAFYPTFTPPSSARKNFSRQDRRRQNSRRQGVSFETNEPTTPNQAQPTSRRSRNWNLRRSDRTFDTESDSGQYDDGEDDETGNGRLNGHLFTSLTSGSGQCNLSTEYQIESIIWRRVLAYMSYDIAERIVQDSSIQIDFHTGDRLLAGLAWLENWLVLNKLERHKRPLDMLIQFANLLSTSIDQLTKMSWRHMRTLYDQVPPSLLNFMLNYYVIDPEYYPEHMWQIDAQDEVAATENPLVTLKSNLDSWLAKESINYPKERRHSTLPYRPRDPHTVYNMNETTNYMQRLDADLAAINIDFRWAELFVRFPPAQRLEQFNSKRSITSGSASGKLQHRISTPRRLRNHERPPAVHMSLSDINVIRRARENTPLHSSFNQPLQRPGPMPTRNQQPGLMGPMKPIRSKGIPTRVVREFESDGEHDSQSMMRGSQALDRTMTEEQLQPHMNGSNLPKFSTSSNRRPSTAADRYLMRRTGSISRAHNALYESQPNLFNYGDDSHESTLGRLPQTPKAFNEVVAPTGSQLDKNNRLAQSLWQLPSVNRDGAKSVMTWNENQKALNKLHEFNQFRSNTTTLGRGLDKLGSPMNSARLRNNPLSHSVGDSLGSLSSQMNPAIVFEGPDEGMSDGTLRSNPSVDGAFKEPSFIDDELSNTQSRSGQCNRVQNITLNRTLSVGFGLVLADGERTLLDQPGVFVKSVTSNSAAEENGEIGLGDRILAINGRDLTGMTYSDALKLLKSCTSQATLTVLRCPLAEPHLLLNPKINPLRTRQRTQDE